MCTRLAGQEANNYTSLNLRLFDAINNPNVKGHPREEGDIQANASVTVSHDPAHAEGLHRRR